MITKIKISKANKKKWLKNLLKFSAPILAIFFYQLSQEVAIEKAQWVAVLALYGALADLFGKVK